MEKFHILLDNGHGKNTKGKRSPVWDDGSQLLEYLYARQTVNEVKMLLDTTYHHEGIEVHIIVPEEEDISLFERAKRVNDIAHKFGKENCLGISIHNNAFNGKATGWEVHTYLGNSVSDRYATIMWSTANQLLDREGISMRADWSDGDPDWDSNFAILRQTNCPFMLTENGFMDNEKECKWLLSGSGRKTIADIHVFGILRCFEYWKASSEDKGFYQGKVLTNDFNLKEVEQVRI